MGKSFRHGRHLASYGVSWCDYTGRGFLHVARVQWAGTRWCLHLIAKLVCITPISLVYSVTGDIMWYIMIYLQSTGFINHCITRGHHFLAIVHVKLFLRVRQQLRPISKASTDEPWANDISWMKTVEQSFCKVHPAWVWRKKCYWKSTVVHWKSMFLLVKSQCLMDKSLYWWNLQTMWDISKCKYHMVGLWYRTISRSYPHWTDVFPFFPF